MILFFLLMFHTLNVILIILTTQIYFPQLINLVNIHRF